MTNKDIDLLSLCLWREARGEGVDGMTAVGCVIRNRVKMWKKTWREVITGKNQFTSMSVPSDSQYNLQPKPSDRNWKAAKDIAQGIYDNEIDDVTKGALYYANLKTADSGWFQKNIVEKPEQHPETTSLGNHTFFA